MKFRLIPFILHEEIHISPSLFEDKNTGEGITFNSASLSFSDSINHFAFLRHSL